MTFREWPFICAAGHEEKRLAWDHELNQQRCQCGHPMDLKIEQRGSAPGIVGDDIPGGIEIRHLSDRPERFYSKTDIKRACNERGWTWNGDTPKPYDVAWSGRTKEEKVARIGSDKSAAES